ncbi:amphiregulin [Chanos chanos]|uniref:Amphiregulin n=1 Tax=Chanos chanos TaxID=29144 RepID=A0A6J2WTK0_CHACN|nr:amphiregulin-like [Chanos chanos]
MRSLLLFCLLCLVFCGYVESIGSVGTFSTALSHVIGMSSSGEGLQSAVGDEVEFEDDDDEDLSGGVHAENTLPKVQHQFKGGEHGKGRKKGRKHKGNKRHRTNGTTAYTPSQRHHTHSPSTTTQDPCSSTHQDYCIHGHCVYMENLKEPICICMKGYDGERCGLHLLKTGQKETDQSSAELVQMVLVVIAVVLSVISCCAIALMICVQYKTHRSFQAAYLSPSDQNEKLQKPTNNVMV